MSKLALITGGTKGIGRAVAECLAANGYDLILTFSADKAVADEVATQISKERDVSVSVLQADISDRKTIDIIAGFLATNHLQLDALVLNAGVTLRSTFQTTTLEDWERVFFANVHFPVFLLQKIVNHLKPQSSVVFTGSLMGIQPHAMSLAYGVTKSAVHALVKNLVKFLQPYNVRVNGVAPGFIDTEWQKTKPADIRKNIENKIALERFCAPEELADVYKMLIENRYINGEIVVVDGAYSYK